MRINITKLCTYISLCISWVYCSCTCVFKMMFLLGSGSIDSVGSGCGLYHTVNVPLEEGITDTQYINIFTRY